MTENNEYCEKHCKGYRGTGGRCFADGRCDAYWEYQKQKGTMTDTTLSNFVVASYKTACDHGFHDEPMSDGHWLCLIVSEIMEAVEADRNSRRSMDAEFKSVLAFETANKDSYFKACYKYYIKGSIEEEFADVVIRVLDMAQEVHGDKMRWLGYYPYGQVYQENESFIENAWYFIREVLNWGTMNISDCVSFMFDWAQHLGIDLWQHIEWKMKYNELRPYKHGGKKY